MKRSKNSWECFLFFSSRFLCLCVCCIFSLIYSLEYCCRVSTFDLSWKRQDSMINQLKSAEQNARSEISTLRAEKSELICSKSSIEQDKLDLQHKLDWTNKELEQAEERNRKLQARCVELTTKAETERKQRFDLMSVPLTPDVIVEIMI